MKPNKENIINEIVLHLEKGGQYAKTGSAICAKFRFSMRTFDKYWKIANERFAERQIAIQNELAKDSADAAKERLKKAIISRDESLAMLSNVAKMLFAKIAGNKDAPDTYDTRALNETLGNISKLEGWNAPAKQDLTTNGKSLNTSFQVEVIDRRENVANDQ